METVHKIADLLRGNGLPGLEARMLLQHVLRVPRVWLITHDHDAVPPEQVRQFQSLLARRLAGEPMAYLLGTREFMGHSFACSPQALIPRPETELLVETAQHILSGRKAPRVLDLGTGTGAIAISIALACPDAAVAATDFSAQALSLARENARRLNARIDFFQGDWFAALPSPAAFDPFDLIVSNPPYIASTDAHLKQGDLRFEPASALTDGADGLTALRRIIAGAPAWLKPRGALWVEHGWDQGAAVRALLEGRGFQQVESRLDLARIERVSGGVWPQ
jgi:release factor glutamine methyltransferase